MAEIVYFTGIQNLSLIFSWERQSQIENKVEKLFISDVKSHVYCLVFR